MAAFDWEFPYASRRMPVLAANMDSITEAAMAKTMALEGGIGLIHRAMSIETQARQVRRVKRSHGYTVESPLCLPRTATIREARAFIRKHAITGILIEEKLGERRLAGLLSNRDIPWIDGEEDRKVEEFMTPAEKLTVRRPGISVEEAEKIMYEGRIEKLPVIDEERRICGLITKKDIILYRQRPYSSKDEKGRLLVGAAIGAHGDYLERAAELLGAGVDILVTAHDHFYERFAPQDPSGVTDLDAGIRTFVVGTGGNGLYSFATPIANSEARFNSLYGVFKLTLHPSTYDWEFVSVPVANPDPVEVFTDTSGLRISWARPAVRVPSVARCSARRTTDCCCLRFS